MYVPNQYNIINTLNIIRMVLNHHQKEVLKQWHVQLLIAEERHESVFIQ